jgi:NADH-quinone oxidoreductase subunit H
VLAGWSSGSKYPLLGAVRSSAQMISYELAMGLSLAAVFIHTGTLQASKIVEAQTGSLFGFLPAWNLVPMIPAFLIFFVAIVAETQRPPFDLPEAEGELVAGFHTEYSGAKFAMFFLAEFMNVITVSAVTVTAFLGGPGPIPSAWEGTLGGALFGMFLFMVKVLVFIFVFVWLRATLPRTRYDRLMDLGWKVLLPFALAWVMITAAVVLYRQQPLAGSAPRMLLIGVGVAAALWLIAPLFTRRSEPDADAALDEEDEGLDSEPDEGLDEGLDETPPAQTDPTPAGTAPPDDAAPDGADEVTS